MAIRDLVPRIGRNRGHVPARRPEDEGLLSFQREMNRLFDDFFRGFGLAPWEREAGPAAAAAFSPRVDVSETDTEIRVSAELPGMDEKDVSVELDETSLTVRGEKKEEREDKGKNWFRREQSYGSFQRIVPLPTRVDGNQAKARFKKGMLTVTLPKQEEDRAGRKTITIESD
ncbi:MAG: Hsp20/alpha crystallin family protein [Lentisphaerae bacterium]|nr:Hsp20/alpha crystallin family protein [Lentisphaerota bacterium]